MAKPVKITKIALGTRRGVTKGTFWYEWRDETDRRGTGEGRFACLAGNEQNHQSLISDTLKKRFGCEVALEMPKRQTLGVGK